ncbi:myb-like protein X-like [Dorcoceras hygrometricum]|uniref:Myb-like protein X-like n=1 Tax=Dorcoceras hygrometricum TaxID=472368 RepID=A0A2Z7AII0_9LAMI|nr:myb-like protein X-like [Dorcoceras hygrometricum]
MEETKRPDCAPEKKQVVVNIGRVSTHSGGGIGGVILLGGVALATAAFASAFIFGRKRRGGSDSHRNTHIKPPPPPAAANKNDERDIDGKGEANKQSSETIKKNESKNENQKVLYEKHRTETNGVVVSDSGKREQILCSNTPKKPENGAISNGGVSHFPAVEEKTLLPLEIEKTTRKILSSGEAAMDENGIAEECKDFEAEGEHGKDGKENGLPVVGCPISKHENVDNDEKQDYLSGKVVEIIHDGEAIRQNEDQPQHIDEHLVQEHGKCNEPHKEIVQEKGEEDLDQDQLEHSDEKVIQQDKDDQPQHIKEHLVQEHDKSILQNRDDQLQHIKEHLVQEHDKCNEPDKEIVPEKGEEDLDQNQLEQSDEKAIQQDEDDQLQHTKEPLVQEHYKCNESDEEGVPVKGDKEKEDQQCEENIEEEGYIDNSTPENRQLGDSGKEDVRILAMHLPEDEPISPKEMEVSEDDAVNGEIEMPFCQQKDTEDVVERNIENEVPDSSDTIDTGIITSNDEVDIIDGTDGDEDLSDEAGPDTEGAVDSSTESNLGGVWPAEAIREPSIETQQEKPVDREIEGKIQEDTTLKRGKYEFHPNKIAADNNQITNGRCNSAKAFIERHVADLATLKDYSTNSGTRKVLLVAIPVLSSISCSWFFGLSFDKFCFVMLLTIVLSKSMIVK